MGFERRVILYEGTDEGELERVKEILSERGIEYLLGFGEDIRFKQLLFPVVSEGMVDLYGSEAIERHFFR